MAEKTEAPTPRRRDEARAKGQGIGRSHEFSMGLTLGVGTLALSSLLPGIASSLVARTQSAIITMDPRASNAQLLSETGGAILMMVTLILPLATLVMVAGIAGNLVSGGLVFSWKAVRFDMGRINPISGMKRMADKQALVRLGLASAKLAILAFISWQVVGSRIPAIVSTEGSDIGAIAGTCLSAVFQLGLTITILLAVVALVDFVVQRRKASQSIRMTKDEVKREYKEQEGDPLVRSARRRRARQMAFARMMDAIPTADVVVTNPTTLAVALKYDSLTMRAPKIVAKGQRLMAERIKQIARDNNVPIVEDKPLARALFSRPLGAEVPAHLYRAVARLLVLVHQTRFGPGGRGGRGGNGAGKEDPSRGRWAGRPGAAVAGFGPSPWWAGAGPIGAAEPTQAAGPITSGPGSATFVSGGAQDPADDAAEDAARGAAEDAADLDDLDGEAWFDEPGDRTEPAPEVDEEALARALAEDELADLTPEDLARYEAEMAGIGNTGPAADQSIDPDEEPDR
jgi:flagellar biosynthesis protein FlhB